MGDPKPVSKPPQNMLKVNLYKGGVSVRKCEKCPPPRASTKIIKQTPEKAQKKKLLLHMNLLPESMLAEIESRRALFPELARVDEIWIIETIFYGTAFGGTYLRFELYENGHVTRSYDFKDEKLLTRFEDGFAEVVNHVT